MAEFDNILVKGLVVGFLLAAPVGPIAVLCVHRTLSQSRLTGFLSGLGAAAADAIYGCIAALGLTLISTLLIEHRNWLQVVGGGFLCIVGVRTFFSKAVERQGAPRWPGLVGAFFSALSLTLTNPMTFLAFAAIFASVGLGSVRDSRIDIGALVAGVFLGSALWWTILIAGAHAFRSRMTMERLGKLNRVAGVIVFGVGLTYLLLPRR
ncbi:MAG: LysE family translocator [Thermoanaerobaculia bacterium]